MEKSSMADILNILNSLSTEKRVLLEKRLRENGSQYNIFPLSFAQQRMWFINQMNPESTAYNIPAAVELTGALNLEALERSINEIINRHEILRTVFRSPTTAIAVSPAAATTARCR
jgi:hypothetical protein